MKPTRPVNADQNLVTDLYRLPDQVRIIDTREGIPEENRSRVISRGALVHLVNETGLDLLCVAPEAPVKVYKLLDYGRFKFEQQKKQREADRKQRENTRTLKECFFSPGISEHDYEIRLKQIKDWLPDHDVKIAMKLNFQARTQLGRHIDLNKVAKEPDFVLNRVIRELGEGIQPTRLQVGEKLIMATVRPV